MSFAMRGFPKSGCRVCKSMEPHTVDRLLLLGHGPSFIAQSGLGVKRRDVKAHREKCLVGERREKVIRDLQRMAGASLGDPGEG